MKISDDKISSIKRLIEENMLDFHNYEYKLYIEDYKAYIWDVSDRLAHKEDWMMNMSQPLVFMMVDTVYWTVFDFDYQLKLKNKNLERACVDAYDFKNYSKQALWMSAKEWLITGTGIMRDYTYREEWTYEAFGNNIDYEIKSPTMEYVSLFNVMYDRMKWLNDSSYKIIRQFLTIDEIKKKIMSAIPDKDTRDKTLKVIKWLIDKDNMAFSMLDYESIKWLMFSTQFLQSMTDKKSKIKKTYTTDIECVTSCDELNFNKKETFESTLKTSPYYNGFDYKYEVIEVIEWTHKHILINWEYILTKEINPNIYNLTAIEFNKVPWSGKSIGIARIIKSIADSSNWLLNMFLDSMKLSNTLIFKKSWVITKKDSTIKIRSWQVISWDIARVNLWWWDFWWMNGMQAMQQLAQSTLGINQMLMGWDSRVQRIAWAFDFAFSQYKARLTPFTDSIDAAMTKIIKWWISQYLSQYSKDELFDLYGILITEVKKKGKITDIMLDEISMKHILNENNISFKFDSMFNLKKDANKKLAMDIFSLAQQYNNSKIDMDAFIKLLAGDSDVKLEDVLWIEKEYEQLDNIDDVNLDELDLNNLPADDSIPLNDTNLPIEEESPTTDELSIEEIQPNIL